MSYGFATYNANGSVQISTDGISLLSVDDFYMSAGTSVTKTYPDTPPANASVVALGSSLINSGATISASAYGAGVQYNISTTRDGWFRVVLG